MTLAKLSDSQANALEQVIIGGDLGGLTPSQRVEYYQRVCQSIGVNPYTKPFAYIKLNGRLTLYALRDCADQLRAIHRLSVIITSRDETENGIYVVTARATTPDGRSDESIGAVAIKGLTGEALANQYMKCETKAKRRVTLSIAGLGWLDETEIGTIPDTQMVDVDTKTGEIKPPPPATRLAQTPPAAQTAPKPGANPERLALFETLKQAREALGWSQAEFLAYAQNNYRIQRVAEMTDEQIREATAYMRGEQAADQGNDGQPEQPAMPGVAAGREH